MPSPPSADDERSERETDLYEQGTDAIDEEQWEEAIRAFSKVAELKGSRADGAVYWSAYALKKLGRRAEALKTLDAFKKAYASSKWLDDANALELELRQASGERVSPDRVDDEDLKMIAINSLMHSDPEKAYPLLEKIVRGKSDKKIRERALFILSQSSSPRAQALLGEIARGNANPDMQREAVRYLGMSGNPKSRADSVRDVRLRDLEQRQERDPPRLHALRRQDPRRQRRARREGPRPAQRSDPHARPHGRPHGAGLDVRHRDQPRRARRHHPGALPQRRRGKIGELARSEKDLRPPHGSDPETRPDGHEAPRRRCSRSTPARATSTSRKP